MRVVVVGSGYVGLVTGTCLAEIGHSVVCVDNDIGRVGQLMSGGIPFYEPGLSELVEKNRRAHRLRFSSDLASAIDGAEIVFIGVGTPARESDGGADLQYVHEVAREIARARQSGSLVVVTKSTVPVGTGDEIDQILRTHSDAQFQVVSNPEFLREGAAIADFMSPDRIVVGTGSEDARELLAELYLPLIQKGTVFLATSRRSAELIKYASNAFLAMKIAFINEMADIAEATGADVHEIAAGMGSDTRIGPRFLAAGPGFGGSCFPKDTLALSFTARQAGEVASLVDATIAANQQRVARMTAKVAEAVGGTLAGARIGVLGLSFKPGTDDIRESPAIALIGRLTSGGAEVAAYDPMAGRTAASQLRSVQLCPSAEELARDCDCLVLATEWPEFGSLDLGTLGALMRQRALVDLRNAMDPANAEKHGFYYFGVGRPKPARQVLAKSSNQHATRLSELSSQ